jgi:hypothetical protein
MKNSMTIDQFFEIIEDFFVANQVVDRRRAWKLWSNISSS